MEYGKKNINKLIKSFYSYITYEPIVDKEVVHWEVRSY